MLIDTDRKVLRETKQTPSFKEENQRKSSLKNKHERSPFKDSTNKLKEVSTKQKEDLFIKELLY